MALQNYDELDSDPAFLLNKKNAWIKFVFPNASTLRPAVLNVNVGIRCNRMVLSVYDESGKFLASQAVPINYLDSGRDEG